MARAIAGADGAAPAERQRGDEKPPWGVLDGVGHVVLQVCLPLALPRALVAIAREAQTEREREPEP